MHATSTLQKKERALGPRGDNYHTILTPRGGPPHTHTRFYHISNPPKKAWFSPKYIRILPLFARPGIILTLPRGGYNISQPPKQFSRQIKRVPKTSFFPEKGPYTPLPEKFRQGCPPGPRPRKKGPPKGGFLARKITMPGPRIPGSPDQLSPGANNQGQGPRQVRTMALSEISKAQLRPTLVDTYEEGPPGSWTRPGR